MNDILSYIIPPVVTGVVSFFAGRKMNRSKLETNELSNVKDSIEIYRDIIEDLKRQIEEMRKNISEIDEDNKKLHEDIKALKEENEKLRKNAI